MNLVSTTANLEGVVGTARSAASVISVQQNKYGRGRAGNIIWRDCSEGKGSSKQKEDEELQQVSDCTFNFAESFNPIVIAGALLCERLQLREISRCSFLS